MSRLCCAQVLDEMVRLAAAAKARLEAHKAGKKHILAPILLVFLFFFLLFFRNDRAAGFVRPAPLTCQTSSRKKHIGTWVQRHFDVLGLLLQLCF